MDIKSFNNWIEEIRSYGIKPGLSRVKELLNRLDNPQNKLDIIHITGTNGKGSTATLLRTILDEAGYKVGQFSTPSIISFNHMFLVNNEPISDRLLLEIADLLKTEITEMISDGFEHPTEYEIIAAMMYVYFYKEHVDFAVVEVAMGGENDCTNVMDHSILSVITPISLDHQGFLGTTLKAIATEKSGVIKNNSVLITHPQDDEVMAVLETVCDQKMTTLKTFSYSGDVKLSKQMTFEYIGLNINSQLIGKHQAQNIIGVIECISNLNERGYSNVSKDQLLMGIEKTTFEGRFECINDWILDGAHNHESLMALKENLESLDIKDLTGVIAVLRDKDIDEALIALEPYFKQMIVTEANSFRKLKAEDLKEKLSALGYKNLIIEKDVKKAFEMAQKTKERKLGFGSFYMLSELRKYVQS